jgi:hypothetical protein
MSSGNGISSPAFETPGYLHAETIFLCATPPLLKSLYIIQISPGAFPPKLAFGEILTGPSKCLLRKLLSGFFHLLFVFIAATRPGTIACSERSGFRKIPKSFCFDKPYWRIFIFECSVQTTFICGRYRIRTYGLSDVNGTLYH